MYKVTIPMGLLLVNYSSIKRDQIENINQQGKDFLPTLKDCIKYLENKKSKRKITEYEASILSIMAEDYSKINNLFVNEYDECDCGNCRYCNAHYPSDYDYETDEYECSRCNGAGCTRCE
jgi:hypothetical protein